MSRIFRKNCTFVCIRLHYKIFLTVANWDNLSLIWPELTPLDFGIYGLHVLPRIYIVPLMGFEQISSGWRLEFYKMNVFWHFCTGIVLLISGCLVSNQRNGGLWFNSVVQSNGRRSGFLSCSRGVSPYVERDILHFKTNTIHCFAAVLD